MKKSPDNKFLSKGSFWERLRSILFLMPSWFSPHTSLRVFFHRLRGVKIGKNVEIGYFCIIGNVHPGNIIIEDNATITARVTLLEHDNAFYYTRGEDVKIGITIIKKGAFIGIGTIVMPNIVIGECSIIGANSVVTHDTKKDCLYGGVPCKMLKSHEEFGPIQSR